MRHALALALFATAAACSPYSISGPTTPAIDAFGPAHTDVATVCMIRSSPWARAVTFIVHDNQTLVGATKGDSYFCYEAEPGAHEIVSDTFDSTDTPGRIRATLQPGARYWLRQDHANHFGSVTSKLAWLDPQSAADLIRDCDYRVVDATPGHEHVPPAVPFAPAMVAPVATR
jgi:hypothetical protein